jgi:hypothetical protein
MVRPPVLVIGPAKVVVLLTLTRSTPLAVVVPVNVIGLPLKTIGVPAVLELTVTWLPRVSGAEPGWMTPFENVAARRTPAASETGPIPSGPLTSTPSTAVVVPEVASVPALPSVPEFSVVPFE